MKLHSAWRIAALALVVALVAGVAPAFADTGYGTVANTVTYTDSAGASTSLQGMTEQSVHDLIAAGTTPRVLIAPLVVTVGGKPYYFDPNKGKAILTDVDGMVAQAYRGDVDASAPYTITPSFKVDSAVVNAWAASVAKRANVAKRDAKRVLKKKRLTLVKERNGLTVDKTATANAITASLTAALANPSVQPATVAAVTKTVKPKVTSKNIKKAILVVLSERKIYLYKGAKLEKKFGCAIGMPGHRTPTGNFKIIAKKKNPSWRNPAPNGWGKNMPAYIPGGPRAPLGVRALYLNVSGIRIHGTYKYSSIGHAASHGCMRVRNNEVVKLYPLVPVGTPVKIIK